MSFKGAVGFHPISRSRRSDVYLYVRRNSAGRSPDEGRNETTQLVEEGVAEAEQDQMRQSAKAAAVKNA